jgi:eukaryotic-like serine/threonine-protein kinase
VPSEDLDAPADDAHRAGDRVGRWHLVRCIGVGGMGSVWEAQHETLKRRVAVKFIHAGFVRDDEARQRFETEAKAASALHSRHAVEMFDHGVTEQGEPFIVMELLIGESLEARLRREGRLSIPATASILVQAARALQQAHDLGIVHRDLKPENLFLAPDEEPGAILTKVLDFGVAKVTGASAALGDAKTKTGTLLGTPYYMAPEQARGARELDGRADLWSLGVIAYRCVTGVLPFEGEALGDLLVNICTGRFLPPSSQDRSLPPAFDAWVARALAVSPAGRFASATELAQSLAEIASSLGGLDRTFDHKLSVPPRLTPVPPRAVILTDGSVRAFAATHASEPAGRLERGTADTILDDDAPAQKPPPNKALYVLLGSLAVAGALVLAPRKAPPPGPEAPRTPVIATPPPLAPLSVAAPDAGAADAGTKLKVSPPSTPRTPAPPALPAPARRPNEGTSADPGF